MPRTPILPADDENARQKAHALLRTEGTVAFPTDTVYGLGADAFSTPAILKLFEIKQRSYNQAIAVLLGDPDQLGMVTENPNRAAMELAEQHWPGALTLVVPRHPNMPEILSPEPTLGVRIPDHPAALALLRLAGPLAVTSANLSGQPNTTTAQEVLAQLDGKIDLLLDGGKIPGGTPSTVVDMTGERPVVLRQGPIHIDPEDY
ncbi:MAG: L-threonylcarbamoyladenylate synthase [Anaerolineales bacterium]|jgi:L-threonylcarbamoyladenylate synthase